MRIMIALALSSCLLFADGGIFWARTQAGSSTAQTAVIKYDRGREELMLATELNAGTGNLAWLVPLPAEPEVDSVSDRVFMVLEQYTPVSEHQLFHMEFTYGGGSRPGAGVTEVSSGFVRNLSYQVLKAFGAETLENYLTGHGYRLPSGTRDAFRHYLDKGWRYYFVARVDSTRAADSGQELGIKLTFATDSIVYPLYISRISSQAGPVVLYVLAEHQQTFPGVTLQFSGMVEPGTFTGIEATIEGFLLPGFIDRTYRLTKLYRRFEPDEMEDLCLRDAPCDNDYVLEPLSPWFVAANPATGKAYALDDKGNLAVIRTVNGDSFASTTLSLRIPAAGIAANPRTNRLYVTSESGIVVELDGENDRPIPPPIRAGRFPWRIAVNPVFNRVYVMSDDSLAIIDARTRAARLVPIGCRATDIAVDTLRDRIFVVGRNDNGSLVTVLSGDGQVVRRAAIDGRKDEGCAVAVDQVTGKAYVARHDDNRVTVLRPDGTRRELATGDGPTDVAVNSVTHAAYVANEYDHNVTVIRDETVVATVPVGRWKRLIGATVSQRRWVIGPGPVAVAVNPVTNRVYVANRDTASVSVINGRDLTTAEVASGDGPWALAVDEKNDRVFVATGGSVTVLDGSGKRSWKVSLSVDTVHKTGDDPGTVPAKDPPSESQHVPPAGPRIPAMFWWAAGLALLFLGGVAVAVGRLLSAPAQKAKKQG